jgi:deazaflavin-dependent oxidoreductase (nitroreductase family)
MTPPRSILRLGWAVHRNLFRLTGGRRGTQPAGGRLGTLFLLTTGRRSGTVRRNGLFYIDDGPNRIVVAPNAGSDVDPGWWRNLRVTPEATIELGRERLSVRAREATHDEAERLWPSLVAANPEYVAYRAKAVRPIPIIVLEPA